MATSHSQSGPSKTPDPARSAAAKKAAATRKRTAAKQAADHAVTATRTAAGDAATATLHASEAEAKARTAQVLQFAERTVDVPVGAGLLARDSIVSTVRGLATTFGDRSRMERELARYEHRGASARNRFGHQVERTRAGFERGVRARRVRVTEFVGNAQNRIGSFGQ